MSLSNQHIFLSSQLCDSLKELHKVRTIDQLSDSKPWIYSKYPLALAKFCLTLCGPVDYVAGQAPLSMGFPRQEYWSGSPLPPPGHLPDPGIKPASPALQVDSLPLSHQGSPSVTLSIINSTINVWLYECVWLDTLYIWAPENTFLSLHKIRFQL